MPHYIGFIRSTEDSHTHLGPDEAQRVLEQYMAWADERTKEGRFVGGGGLSKSGRVLRGSGGEVVAAGGPHTEATEIVGGYQVIEADDLDQAEKIFATHPHLDFGPIEVRKVGERGCED
ncbi:YciI family protein [Amycolatopsis sp. lyj-112]|uniref:YciI family protein n=1 Tax=Amycolatopsis sp. lyj-112 TaxID=2789288 RepID=UPI00397C49C1